MGGCLEIIFSTRQNQGRALTLRISNWERTNSARLAMSGTATGNEPMYCDRKNSVLEAMREKSFLGCSFRFREKL